MSCRWFARPSRRRNRHEGSDDGPVLPFTDQATNGWAAARSGHGRRASSWTSSGWPGLCPPPGQLLGPAWPLGWVRSPEGERLETDACIGGDRTLTRHSGNGRRGGLPAAAELPHRGPAIGAGAAGSPGRGAATRRRTGRGGRADKGHWPTEMKMASRTLDHQQEFESFAQGARADGSLFAALWP